MTCRQNTRSWSLFSSYWDIFSAFFVHRCHSDLTASPYQPSLRISSHCNREGGTLQNCGVVVSQGRGTTWNFFFPLTGPHVAGLGLCKALGLSEWPDWRDKDLWRCQSSWLPDTSADWFKGSLQELNLKGQFPLLYFRRNLVCWGSQCLSSGQKQNSNVTIWSFFVFFFTETTLKTRPSADTYLHL